MNEGTVLVSYLHPGKVSHSFSDSLNRLLAFDLTQTGRVVQGGGPLMFRCGPGGLEEARNDIMSYFLDKTESEWLFCIDSDMGFTPDIVENLVAAADPEERPVVGGLCFSAVQLEPDRYQGFKTYPVPTLFIWSEEKGGFIPRGNYPVNTLVQVAGTGAACLLIHRTVGEKIREAQGPEWFDRLRYRTGMKISEDLSFCYRCSQVGVPIFVHTGIRTTHHKEFWLSETDYWSQYRPPPASDLTAVVVPVLGRPEKAAPFMRSLRASTGMACAYAVAHEDDTQTVNAWRDTTATVLVGPEKTFAQKVNRAFRETHEPWVFIVGDDVDFHAGWLDHAQHTADLYRKSVIGTNDLGNPRVLAGDHATHLLIERSYVEEQGASWDGPGVVCHQGYAHNCVDDEIVAVAKQRGEWAMALGSIVEHIHPAWGKAATDSTYELGSQTLKADWQRFQGRCGSYGYSYTRTPAGVA